MADYISDLPDDILCYIVSFLTVRDAFRVRRLSTKWKDLPGCRSVLQFDVYTVFGEVERISKSHALESKFVKAVDQFLEHLGGSKISVLKIKYRLGNGYGSHIDGWIASVASKEVEVLDLDFSNFADVSNEGYQFFFPSFADVANGGYIFPCHLLHTEKGSNKLKHFRLKYCHLTLNTDACTSWLSKLSTIEFSFVPLRPSDVECIVSIASNLESLSLFECNNRGYQEPIRIQHPFLKKLVIVGQYRYFELRCPRLEIIELSGQALSTFFYTPLLREVSLSLLNGFPAAEDFSLSVLSDLVGNSPQLQALSYWVKSDVPPISMSMTSLKRLEFVFDVPKCFDILSVTNFVYASPMLEELCIKAITNWRRTIECPQSKYVDRPHFHLKEVRIEGKSFYYVMELVEYLLRNCVTLLRMVFIVGAEYSSLLRGAPMFTMLQNINPDVELIVV